MGQIETAMVASMLAALKVEREERSLFQAALETAGEFLQLIKEPQQLRLVHLIEMKLLVRFVHLDAVQFLIRVLTSSANLDYGKSWNNALIFAFLNLKT